VIVIPTFNEKHNIGILMEKIEEVFLKEEIEGSILVVDDNSPDGTARVVEDVSARFGNIELIEREGRRGLGSAYRDGFSHALDNMGADIVFEMDADLSHNPEFIPDLLGELSGGCEVVVGSRHIKGGRVEGWSLYRHLVSGGGNMLAKVALGLEVTDVTTGFRAYRAGVLREIDYQEIGSEGYGFQIETLFRCSSLGFEIGEVPIVFINRRAGRSKLGSRQMLQFISTIWRLFLTRLLGQDSTRHR